MRRWRAYRRRVRAMDEIVELYFAGEAERWREALAEYLLREARDGSGA